MTTSKASGNFHDYVEVSSQNLLKRLERCGVEVKKQYTRAKSEMKFSVPVGGEPVVLDGGDYVKPVLNRAEAPLWAITVMTSDLLADVADNAVRRLLSDEESLAALITLFVVLDAKDEWRPEDAARAVLEVIP